jgi:hypothetical protein
MMLGVLGCALFAAGLREPEWRGWLLTFAGPVCGALFHQSRGGKGVLGGAIGGGISFGLVMAVYALCFLGPTTSDLLFAILVSSFAGTVIGLFVGLVMLDLKIGIGDKGSRYPWWPSLPHPSKPEVKLPASATEAATARTSPTRPGRRRRSRW